MAKNNLMVDNMLSEVLPTGLLNLSDDNHIENMANFSIYANAKQAVNGDPINPPPDDFDFGKEGDSIDTKQAARYLQKKGLVGSGQIIEAQPNLKDANSIKNSQADWKVAAIQQIVSNAERLNLRKPEEVLANKDVLVANSRWRDAINNDSFKSIHPNFWEVITQSILPEQYKKYDSRKDVAKK